MLLARHCPYGRRRAFCCQVYKAWKRHIEPKRLHLEQLGDEKLTPASRSKFLGGSQLHNEIDDSIFDLAVEEERERRAHGLAGRMAGLIQTIPSARLRSASLPWALA